MPTRDYYGYIPPSNTLDWAKLTGGLVDTITGISDERQQQRDELDKINIENQKVVSSVDSYSNQTLNEFVLSTSVDARAAMSEWYRQLKNREITPAEYKNRNNNLMTNWAALGTSAKTLSARIQEATTRAYTQDENGEYIASDEELFKIGQMAEYADLKNKKSFIDRQTGNLMTGVLDPETGQVDPNSLVTGVAMNNPENIQVNKMKVDKIISEYVRTIGDYSIESGRTTISGNATNPEVAKVKASIIASIMNNPSGTASVLADNTTDDVQFYSGTKQRNQLITDMIKKQNETRFYEEKPPMTDEETQKFFNENSWMMIQMSRDGNGVMRPNLTPEQEEKARLIILGKIDAQLDYKKTQGKPPAKEGPKNNQEKPSSKKENTKSGPTDAQINAKNKGTEIYNIISSGDGVAEKLKRASGGEYDFKWNSRTKSWYAIKPGAKNPSFSGMKNSGDFYKIFSRGQESYFREGAKKKLN
jgi:hypothetical protein